ncbi:MAG TPA: helix-turn-helix transcriptional regulator [Blastocatellia bacterium]|nr:helix-turn-helix transcriptional regulator [Blastocatellia bacterium]
MAVAEVSSFGELLRRWRETRRVSQLELGLEAGVSARHLSFIETGRARPSREMVVILSGVLDIPLRERNVLLHAAGYAPVYRETSLNDPQMAQVRQALQMILRQMEPFGAIAFDRRWDILMANAAFLRFNSLLFGESYSTIAPLTVTTEPRHNLLHLLFDPAGWRPYMVNWETVAKAVLERVHREIIWDRDPAMRELLDAVLGYPDVPARWSEPDFEAPQDLIIPVEMRVGERTLRLFSTITTLGSPQDITLRELRIESFHPVDETSEQIIRSVVAG